MLRRGWGRRRAALTNMASLNQLVATAVVEKVRVALGCEGPALWRRVADAMQLSHGQRADVLQLWRSFRRVRAPAAEAVPVRAPGVPCVVRGLLPSRSCCGYVPGDPELEAARLCRCAASPGASDFW